MAERTGCQLDATAPLAHAKSHLARRIGVTVRRPFFHHGLGAVYVDVERETVTVNTSVWGNCYPVAETAEKTEAAVGQTLADLDALIDDLVTHRDRLARVLAEIPGMAFAVEPPKATTGDMT